MSESARRSWQRMRALVLDSHDRRPRVVAELGMSFIRIKALRQVARGALTMTELTERLSTDKPYTTLIVDDLEERGLVERTVSPADRRRKIVTITKDGLAVVASAERILNEPPAELLALEPGEQAELDRILAKLAAPSGSTHPGQ
ncbi:MarR family winged helix-turn-helix transcriptional regulator [Amycolatopsis sp. NPDC059021]|uniref:MarR family winged helix-turn-helix transcriptional regulator n=1 Tax=Amycolatopsis sp. NPDC059021 TaxID=3346704 RepID=UPI00366D7C1E